MSKNLQFKYYILIGLIIFCLPLAFYSFSLLKVQYEKFITRPLTYHESLGGHTISRHIEISDEQMLDRFINGVTPKAVSKFYDRNIAEKAIRKVLKDNKEDIIEFLGSHQEYFLVHGTYDQELGYGTTYRRFLNGEKDFIPTKSLIIILKKSKGTVFILTAYPEIH